MVRRARDQGAAVSVAAGRHAMGGQQFGDDTRLIDMNGLSRLVHLDRTGGLVEVEAGIQWPALIEALERAQGGNPRPWGIVQKQTGADRLSLGGALAANVHGRGLRLRPIVQDVESFTLIDARGRLRRCSRTENAELFRLAIGGYGLFGVIATVALRLMPRVKLERVVEIRETEGLMPAFEARIAEDFLYGDFQFSTDADSEGFLRRGVFSCYRPADPARPVSEGRKRLSEQDWIELIALGHADKRRAFELYSAYYLSTSGQVYWSDRHQLSTYVDDYHAMIDRRLGATRPGTEMITEIYVPRPALHEFMEAVRRDFLAHGVDFIYGTVRLIERDEECFLTWAREAWACVIFNLHVGHGAAGQAKAAEDFRRLIDRAVERGGSYFLTYHRWAARAQVERCHPRLVEFLHLKRRHDPEERFQSDWYRHYRTMFVDEL
jgi:FAD/FMN-containing dehydrogenase